MANHDSFLMRAKDWGLLILILTVLGIIGTYYRRTEAWDNATMKVNDLQKDVYAESVEMAILRTQLQEVNRNLEKISYQLEKMRR